MILSFAKEDSRDRIEAYLAAKQVDGLSEKTLSGYRHRADGELCRLWTAEDFQKILTYAMNFIFYNRTYCNHLNTRIRRSNSAAELLPITYGSQLPDGLAASMQELIGAAEEDGVT